MAKYVTDAFPSKFLSAKDVKDAGEPVVTIIAVDFETIRNDRLAVVTFRELSKKLVLKKTTARQIATITGTEDMDDWNGVKIRLIVALVEFKGDQVPAVRVAAPPSRPVKSASRRTKPAADPAPDRPFDEDEESTEHDEVIV